MEDLGDGTAVVYRISEMEEFEMASFATHTNSGSLPYELVTNPALAPTLTSRAASPLWHSRRRWAHAGTKASCVKAGCRHLSARA